VFFFVIYLLFKFNKITFKDFYYQKDNILYARVVSLDEDTLRYLQNEKNSYFFFKYDFFSSLKNTYVFFNVFYFKDMYACFIDEIEEYVGFSLSLDKEQLSENK
jgi:hypothetical protein